PADERPIADPSPNLLHSQVPPGRARRAHAGALAGPGRGGAMAGGRAAPGRGRRAAGTFTSRPGMCHVHWHRKETASLRFIRSALLHAAIFAVGAVTSVACFNKQLDYDSGFPPFRCSPAEGADECPDDYACCSDDPAAQMGLLPAYR